MEIDNIVKEFKEVISLDTKLDKRSEEISKIVIFTLNNSISLFKDYLKGEIVLTLEEIYEVVLHTSPYIGISKSYEFLKYLNENYKIEEKTFDFKDKTVEGNNKQIEIFGESMRDYHLKGDDYFKLINKYLALNCFGDFYARGVLSLKDRELIVFNLLYAMGDAPSQLKGHIKGNLNVGNSKDLLLKVILNNIPYVGYPRSLNAINILKEVCEA